MRNRRIKWLFPIISLLFLLPWPVAYAFEGDAAAEGGTVRIEVAGTPAQPHFTAWGSAVGGVSEGALFYIDAAGEGADILATLYLINAQDLVGHFTFMNLKVGVYVENDGRWEKASGSNGEIPEAIISMRNGQVSFLLPGYAKYKVAIDSGSFYCHNADSSRDGLSPEFFLEVN